MSQLKRKAGTLTKKPKDKLEIKTMRVVERGITADIPASRGDSRAQMLLTASALRTVINAKLKDMKNSISEVKPSEIQQMANALNMVASIQDSTFKVDEVTKDNAPTSNVNIEMKKADNLIHELQSNLTKKVEAQVIEI